MRKKGFTLIELLVVIAIIAMLMAILMPALGRVKRLAQRLVCGTNLKGLGTACVIYASENDEEFPIAGGRGTQEWASMDGQDQDYWYDPDFDWSGNDLVTVSASMYLLVREADVAPKVFVCKASGEKAFEGTYDDGSPAPNAPGTSSPADIVEMWDFGDKPRNRCSYSYHFPYEPTNNNPAYPLSGMSSPGMAAMADKSPFYDEELEYVGTLPTGDEDFTGYASPIPIPDNDDWESVPKEGIQAANSGAHLREGQNVVYLDGHAEFEKRSDVGVENDNIFTQFRGGNATDWNLPENRRQGNVPRPSPNAGRVKSDEDNWLVNDEENQ